MKHYKDSNNNIFAFASDGSQDHLIQNDYVQITSQDVASINQAKQRDVFNTLSYAEKRATEYPDFRDYLDGIVKGNKSQVQAYIDACLAVKEKYPKE